VRRSGVDWYRLFPAVAGGLGEATDLDTDVTPPRVRALHYEFEGWDGDALVESYPCFLVTQEAGEEFRRQGFTGLVLREVRVSTSDVFEELYPGVVLPAFQWLDVTGAPGRDDLGLTEAAELVVSGRVFEVVRDKIPGCDVEPF